MTEASAVRPDARALAAARIAAPAPPPPAMDDPTRLAVAWALKDEAYAAWSSDPSRVTAIAAALAAWVADDAEGPAADEARAVGDWVAAVASLARGEMAEALVLMDRASAAFAALGQRLSAAQAQVPKVMALSVLGRHAEAASSGEATLAALLAAGDKRGAAKVGLNLGNLHVRRNQPAQALGAYRLAAVQFARLGDGESSVMADIGLGDALAAVGEFDEALRIQARARMRAQRLGLPVLAAMADESAALVHLARGEHAQALAGLERARRHYAQLALPQHLATAEKQLADAYLELRLLPEAMRLFDQALLRFAQLQMPVERAWALVQRARAGALHGEAPAAIEATLAQAGALFAAQEVPAGLASVVLARSELALASAAPAQAAVLARQAADAFGAVQREDAQAQAEALAARALFALGRDDEACSAWQATLLRAEALGLHTTAWLCLIGLGDVAAAQGDGVVARRAYEAVIERFEAQRGSLPDEAIQQAFLVDHLRPYEALLGMALDDAAQGRGDALQVLRCQERMRARVLAQRLGDSAPPADEPADERALRERLNWIDRRQRRQREEGDAPLPGLAEERRALEHRLLEQARRRRLTETGQPRRPAADAFDAEALRRGLRDDEVLVAYGVCAGELFASVVDAQGVRLQRNLARWDDALQTVHAARLQLEAPRAAGAARHAAQLAQRCRTRLQQLHGLLWRPLALPASTRRVLVVAPPPLDGVPFAALHDGEGFLAGRCQLASAPSAHIAAICLAHPARSGPRALVLSHGSGLAHAADEARAVAALFAQPDLCLGDAATLSALRTRAAGADLIHLACHADFRADNPRFSALQLADGPLTVEQVERLPLGPGLVALAACETGQTAVDAGDEAVGLVRAFLLAGAARVLASLWPVDDAATARFMLDFHAQLAAGNAPGLALQKAQRCAVERADHPFAWAAFTLHGGW